MERITTEEFTRIVRMRTMVLITNTVGEVGQIMYTAQQHGAINLPVREAADILIAAMHEAADHCERIINEGVANNEKRKEAAQ